MYSNAFTSSPFTSAYVPYISLMFLFVKIDSDIFRSRFFILNFQHQKFILGNINTSFRDAKKVFYNAIRESWCRTT